MGNCLVTKLQGVVNNPDLLKIGEFRIKGTGNDNLRFYMGAHNGAAWTLNIIQGTGHFCTDETYSDNIGTTMQITQENGFQNVYCTAGSLLQITDKYKINNLSLLNDATIEINLEDLKGSTNLRSFPMSSNVTLIGSLSNVYDLPLEDVNITSPQFYNEDICNKWLTTLKAVSAHKINWTHRDTTGTIFNLIGDNSMLTCDLGDTLDAYLANIVNCQLPEGGIGTSSISGIRIIGTATSNTPALASALKQKIGDGVLTVNYQEITE